MPTFEPPTQLQGCDDIFWGRYSIPVGQSVVMRDGHYRTTPTPWIGELDGLVDGVDYFLGGHVYEVTGEVALALEADGYLVSRDGESFYGSGTYGTGTYGGGTPSPAPPGGVYGYGTYGGGLYGA